MTRQTQRDGIGVPAHDRRILAGELARRLGQTGFAAGKARPLGCEGDFELGWRAIARRHPITARLNGSVGASFAGVLLLMFEDMLFSSRLQKR